MKAKYYAMPIFYMMIVITIAMMKGCSDESSSKGVRLEMKATTTQSTISKGGRKTATGYSFKEAKIGVSEFEFETLEEDDSEDYLDAVDGEEDDGEDDNEEIEFEGNFIVDLIAGTSNPEFSVSTIAPGLYEEVEVELGRALPKSNTIFISLKFMPAVGDSVTVEFSTQDELEFEFEKDNGFELDSSVLKNILVLINLDVLFDGVDFSSAPTDTDGVIRINDTTNTSLAQKIKDNLEKSCEVGEDDDGDDEIDDDNN